MCRDFLINHVTSVLGPSQAAGPTTPPVAWLEDYNTDCIQLTVLATGQVTWTGRFTAAFLSVCDTFFCPSSRVTLCLTFMVS